MSDSLFFLKNFCLFIYFGLAGSLLLYRLSLVVASGGYPLDAGFSLGWLLLLWSTGSRCMDLSSCGALVSCSAACGTRDRTHVSCTGRRALYHRASLATWWTVICQAPLSKGFPRQEYQSGLPFSFSRRSSQCRDWTHIESVFSALQVDYLLPPGKPTMSQGSPFHTVTALNRKFAIYLLVISMCFCGTVERNHHLLNMWRHLYACLLSHFSYVWLFVTPWTCM